MMRHERSRNMKFRKLLFSLSVSFFLGIASVSSAQQTPKGEIPLDLVKWLIKDITKTVRISKEEMADLNENLKCELHDLNDDGVPEFLLYIDSRFWCGANGANCNCWLVQKTKKGYKVLLEEVDIRVQDSVTNGYRDLLCVGTMWSSMEIPNAQEVSVTLYTYDGKKYRERRSYDAFTPFEQ
jgi:hypothetical protein